MTNHEMARKVAEVNFEIVIAHGVADGGVGFVWHETFIHNTFADPQYGAFEVDPVQQYGDAYLQSIFVTDPANALQTAQHQLRTLVKEEFTRFCDSRGLDTSGKIATIENACSVRVPESEVPLEGLTDDQISVLWNHIDQPNTRGRKQGFDVQE